MERDYHGGLDQNLISLRVKVGTPATVYSNAFQRLSGGQKIIKGESSMTSNGNIATVAIGNAGQLKNTKMVVQTTVDFRALPDDVQDAIRNDPHAFKTNLVIEYTFDGGFSGLQTFDYDYDDYVMGRTQTVAVVTKEINLQQ